MGRPNLFVSRASDLGLDCLCRDPADVCGLQIRKERDSGAGRDCLLGCSALVPAILDGDPRLRKRCPLSYQRVVPTSPPTRWLRPSAVFIIWWGVGVFRRRWSTWALWALPSPWAGFTSATSWISLTARWADRPGRTLFGWRMGAGKMASKTSWPVWEKRSFPPKRRQL